MNLTQSTVAKHTFEQSGLGKPPYQVINPKQNAFDKGQVFWCEHCGTTLKNRYFIKSCDGVISIVGIDCLKKTGDLGLKEGIKRLARERRAEERERLASEMKEARLLKEREKNGGITNAELASHIRVEIANKRGLFIERNEHNAVIKSLTQIGFERAMALQFYSIEPYTLGQLSVIKKIYTKKVTRSRLNSKTYKNAYSGCAKEVDELNHKIMTKSDELEQLRKRAHSLEFDSQM